MGKRHTVELQSAKSHSVKLEHWADICLCTLGRSLVPSVKNHWLKWNSETILKRVQNNPKRPIAFNLTNIELMKLIKKRSIIYSKALYSINCDGLSKKQIVNKVKKIYETNKINC